MNARYRRYKFVECMQIGLKDDTIYSEKYPLKKAVCLHFLAKISNIAKHKTKNLACKSVQN